MKHLVSTNSVLNFFLALFVLTIASIFFFAPSKRSQTLTNEDIPKIELRNFNMYQANGDFVDMKIEGSRALQFDDYEILYDFLASRYNTRSKKIYEYISGDKVIRKGDIYDFPNGAVYTKSDGGGFWSEKGTYDYRKEIFRGKGHFVFDSPEGDVEGKNIIYNRKTQMIQAIHITSEIHLSDGKKEKK
ncbi:hypothetical protein [Helicobacter sp. 11S02596-1]|uniref:hypothetical protein n=1 Tax=Helicobacter sp. 11S02596-1 TaxID=1476194 RepID=UPI000BA67298|nr:hypothetical protein [Helicobacter sp. 11S02596-1]PAF42793.1 hypothetical protein BJI48_05905 [Helicobacter sp. 11S02596-1]